MKTPNRIYVSIDLDAVSYNLESMKNNIREDTKIIAVLKADGYGHGALPLPGISNPCLIFGALL